MKLEQAVELIRREHERNEMGAATQADYIDLLKAAWLVLECYEHSEWLRSRQGIVYNRVGDEVI